MDTWQTSTLQGCIVILAFADLLPKLEVKRSIGVKNEALQIVYQLLRKLCHDDSYRV